uniref:Uncharacterized protein n=1 Tax=Anguilla anguilla TaxID=7936 RepID=A0A0E9WDW0_ANGAN
MCHPCLVEKTKQILPACVMEMDAGSTFAQFSCTCCSDFKI